MSLEQRVIIFFWFFLLFATVPVKAEQAQAAKRIVSLSLCTDQLLLMLVKPERIAALSYLATNREYSYRWQAAQGLKLHHGLAEEIISLQPDLIIDNRYTSGNTQNVLKRLGYPIAVLDSPNSLIEVEEVTRAVGHLVGEEQKAEGLIQQFRQDLAQAHRSVAHLPMQRALSYGPNGYTVGSLSLKNEAFQLVSYTNIAAELGIAHYGYLSVEQVVALKPDAMVFDELQTDQFSLAQKQLQHPVLQRLLSTQAIKAHRVPTSYWLCPDVTVAEAVKKLAEQRLCAHC